MARAAKRKSDVPAASVAKRVKRVECRKLEPFSVDALRRTLNDVDANAPPVDGSPTVLDLLELELATMDPTWLKALADEFQQPYFLELKRYLWRLGLRATDDPKSDIFPPATDVYAWSRHTPLDKVRVVILGQDPYHNVGQAHGLAFSVRHGVPVPASLRNIHKEMTTQFPGFVPPKHGNLEAWAKAGVLLLNASLTVTAHQAGSHQKQGWEDFTSAAIRAVDATDGVVFLAWGKPAEKGVARVDRDKHLVLTSAHPSPLSATRGFFGNNHFNLANEWLRARYGEQGTIDWTDLNSSAAHIATTIHSEVLADTEGAESVVVEHQITTATVKQDTEGVTRLTKSTISEEHLELELDRRTMPDGSHITTEVATRSEIHFM